MIEVKRVAGKILVAGEAHDPDETRNLVMRIWAAMPVVFADDGAPICPKCGCKAFEDANEFWVCHVVECDGYHQTVYEGRPR